MKDIRFSVSLYITIPVIFAGCTILSIILAYRLTLYYLAAGMSPTWPVAFWGALLVMFTFGCGLLIVKFLIDPMQKFVARARTMGVMKDMADSGQRNSTSADIQRFSLVFDQVTEILSTVKAREMFPDIIGQSNAIRGVFNQIMKVAGTDSTVLILGETGTGKELISKSIHRHSDRQSHPFVAINCAAIPQGLLESELFGHEKGAFTGAVSRKKGKFEIASGGTVFLDEIGDMPFETQAKVLRALEDHCIERVGGVKPVPIDVRFITATNKDLEQMVDHGQFRNDLYFRLNVFTIHLPPLRQRREDIPLLAEHFLSKVSKELQLSRRAMQLLVAYDWPGNVRELQNAIASAAVMADQVIEPNHLPSAITQGWHTADSIVNHEPSLPVVQIRNQKQPLDDLLKQMEKDMIQEALRQTGGIQTKAARLLGIKERSLWHRLKKFDIKATDFK